MLDIEVKIVSIKNINSAIHTNNSLIKGMKVTIYHPLTKHQVNYSVLANSTSFSPANNLLLLPRYLSVIDEDRRNNLL